MSIRLIAQDLYRLINEVEKIENKIEKTPLMKRDALKDQLRKAIAERDRMRRVLDGSKEQ